MLGIEYMYKAGYDPGAFVDFFEKVQSQEKRQTRDDVQAVLVPSADR